jgi:hypothetical protein
MIDVKKSSTSSLKMNVKKKVLTVIMAKRQRRGS